MDSSQNDQLEQAVAQIKRRTSSLCSTPVTPISRTSSRPQTPQQNGPLTPPDTVVLGLWSYATDEQIDFYIDGYNILFPSARIIALRSDQTNAALDILTPINEKPASQHQEQVLLHLFGNDGASRVVDLLRSYRTRTGNALPIRAVVMDSIPAMPVPTFQSAIELPHQILLLAYVTIWTIYTWILSVLTLGYSDTASEQLRQSLHDPSLVPASARKVYIWASRDLMFSWKSSAKHSSEEAPNSDECESYEYAVKRSTVDEKGRWTGNQERYWLGLENAWEGGGSL